MKFSSFSQTKLGSSLSVPAHGGVGERATLLFLAAHFAKQNTNSVGVQSEGEAEGGCGGNSASPERQFRSKKVRVFSNKGRQNPTFRFWRPREESNLYLELRSLLFCPLNYGGKCFSISVLNYFLTSHSGFS